MNTDLGELLLPAVIAAVVSVVVMESYQTTPWLADKLMRWSVRLRYADNPERAKVRGEELIGLLEDLPTLFKLPTAGGFVLRALAYRLANHRSHPRRQPRAVRHSLGTGFRIALVKASLVVVCTGTVIWTEIVLVEYMVYGYTDLIFNISWVLIQWVLMVGIAAASEVAARPSKVPHGLVGGIIFALVVVAAPSVLTVPMFFYYDYSPFGFALLSGTTFAVASSVTYVFVRKLKYIGVIVGTLIHIAGVIMIMLGPNSDVFVLSGAGFASGALAGFAVAVARRAQDKIGRSSGSAVVRASGIHAIDSAPKPSIPMSEPRRQDPSTIKVS